MNSIHKSFNYRLLCRVVAAIFIFLFTNQLYAQKDTTSPEYHRGHSGIDPILIHSKILYNLYVLDSKGPAAKITFTPGVSFGVKTWGISLKASAVSDLSGNPGDGFHSGFGDIKVSVQNRIFARGKHAIAISGELALPTGKLGYGGQYLSLTPIFKYTYLINPSLIFALQPLYTFHLIKDPLYPDLSYLSMRALIARFTKTGSAYGLEFKPNINLITGTFEPYLSPFLSLNLGSGFNMLLLCDLPVNSSAIKKGPTYQLGINRNLK